MLVSIIIPLYNCEKYVAEAIESAIKQSWNELEIIVVDDGSTDSSGLIASKYYHSKQIKLITHTKNKGTAGALNTGISHARGDYIKWLSADDVLLPTAIEHMMEYIIHNHAAIDPEYTIFYTDYDIIDSSSKKIDEWREPPERNYKTISQKAEELMKYFYGNGSTSLIHKNVFEACGLFDEHFRHSEDYEFWLRCCMLYGVDMHHIPLITLNYRRHPEQLTNKVGGSLDKEIRQKILYQFSRK